MNTTCAHDYELDFKSSIYICAHCGRMRRTDPVPEGCTPADARMLRKANHELAIENHKLREALKEAQAATQRTPQPMPPVPLATLAEQQAFVFGWFKALETTQHMHEALQIIATPQRPDGTWNRDREACRQIAAEALGFHNKGNGNE